MGNLVFHLENMNKLRALDKKNNKDKVKDT